MRVLVCTIVHHSTDARIFRRQIGALLEAGHSVSVIAPGTGQPDVPTLLVPRAHGRRRFAAWRAARSRIRELAPDHDLLVIHDPELLCVLPWRELRRANVRVVWDVHEDLAAALVMKTYLPTLLRRLLVPAIGLLERWAERRVVLLLAESAYQERFRQPHPVVLNLPPVPETFPSQPRKRQALYVGSITRARGLDRMLAIAPLLAEAGIALRIIGEAPNAEDAARLRSTPNVEWNGALPNAAALQEVEQSMVGLALLADEPNYRHSMPTKILEYMASGTPVVATPLPLSKQVIGDDGVVLADFTAPPEVVAGAVIALCNDEVRRERMARAGFERVRSHYNWNHAKREFIAALAQSIGVSS